MTSKLSIIGPLWGNPPVSYYYHHYYHYYCLNHHYHFYYHYHYYHFQLSSQLSSFCIIIVIVIIVIAVCLCYHDYNNYHCYYFYHHYCCRSCCCYPHYYYHHHVVVIITIIIIILGIFNHRCMWTYYYKIRWDFAMIWQIAAFKYIFNWYLRQGIYSSMEYSITWRHKLCRAFTLDALASRTAACSHLLCHTHISWTEK